MVFNRMRENLELLIKQRKAFVQGTGLMYDYFLIAVLLLFVYNIPMYTYEFNLLYPIILMLLVPMVLLLFSDSKGHRSALPAMLPGFSSPQSLPGYDELHPFHLMEALPCAVHSASAASRPLVMRKLNLRLKQNKNEQENK